MRPVSKGDTPKDDNGDDKIFEKHSRARRYLIDRIGEYCYYCERKIETNLAVEHVKPKALNPQLELKWSNFLLGCTNCNSTKGAKDVDVDEYLWCDSDDTFNFFSCSSDGLICPKANLSISDKIKANNTISLVGLDKKSPKKGTVAWEEASDRRQEQRIEAIITSQDNVNTYRKLSVDIKVVFRDLIVTIVKHQGFWSIWMDAFSDFPEVQKSLIDTFPGTNKSYFQNLYNE
jgi:uncharacterized protein (TIGR02646 family)